MANVYSQNPPAWELARKKPKKTTFGWSLAPKRNVVVKKTPKRSVAKKPPVARTAPGVTPKGVTNPDGTFDPYPGYNDPYAKMLSQLAAMNAQQQSDLLTNLTGREAAIKKLYADQGPLVDANYNQAIKSSAAVNDAVANRLGIEGQTAGGDLLSKLSMIGAPQGATDLAAKQVKDYYSGLGGANYAMDAGDVQRLIGAQAEENTYIQKQPGIISQQLESNYASDLRDMLQSYNEQVMGLTQAQAQGVTDYQMAKFGYEQDQKTKISDAKAARIKDNEERYWDNYWKVRAEKERRYEIAVASKDKKTANQLKAQLAADANQAKIDVANIKSDTAITVANTPKPGSTTKPPKVTTGATIEKAKKAARFAIINPSTGRIRDVAKNDSAVQSLVNNILNQYGIPPYSSQGTAIRKWVFAQMNGRKNNQGQTYTTPKNRMPK